MQFSSVILSTKTRRGMYPFSLFFHLIGISRSQFDILIKLKFYIILLITALLNEKLLLFITFDRRRL